MSANSLSIVLMDQVISACYFQQDEAVHTNWAMISANDIDGGYNGLVTYAMEVF